MLPAANTPNFQIWQQALQMQIPKLEQDTIIVAHSLGCLASLHFFNS
ncbi:alpha/beta hydrolase [Acinetobacter sp. TSRC1-2]